MIIMVFSGNRYAGDAPARAPFQREKWWQYASLSREGAEDLADDGKIHSQSTRATRVTLSESAAGFVLRRPM
jgi:hypothetical protein